MALSKPFLKEDITMKQSFFRKWHRFVDLEEECAISEKAELWRRNIDDKVKKGTCLYNLKVVRQEKQESSGMRRFKAMFVPSQDPLDSGFDYRQISPSDPIVVSSTSEENYGLAIGFVEQVGFDFISVYLDRELKPALVRSTFFDSEYNHDLYESSDQIFRIDKDELVSSFGLMRANLIKLFAEECQPLCKVIVQEKTPSFVQNEISIPNLLQLAFERINTDQAEAIKKILDTQDLSLVLGMPGTGKTTMLALVIAILVSQGKKILISSYTHSAVDNVLEMLTKEPYSSFVSNVLRLGDPERISKKIPRKWVLADKKFDSLGEVEQAYQEAQAVATTCLGINHPLFLQIRFDYVFVDEASQVSLPACLGPLRFGDHFVLIGDHHQLPPLVKSRQACQEGLATSLFEVLAEKYPQAVAYLTIQYRMNKPIMDVANKLMYSGRLRAADAAIENQRLLEYAGLSGEQTWIRQVMGMQVAFIDTDEVCGICGETRVGSSFSNTQEAYMIEGYVNALSKYGNASIGVISLYRPQTALLQDRLKGRVEVSTVDQYQGRDRDCIVVSLVRSNPEGHVGELMSNMNRINVAFTRARLQLVIFGSRRLVENFCIPSSDARWPAFWQHMVESGYIVKGLL